MARKKMSDEELVRKIDTLKEYERIQKEASEIIESLKDELKSEMNLRHADTLNVGVYTIHYTQCLKTGFDAKKFSLDFPDIAQNYITTTSYKRFSVAYNKDLK